MASTNVSTLGRDVNTQHHNTPRMAKFYYQGRVRSGCLTCRARKVKCDEQRPSCHKCTRLNRTCIYKAKSNHTSASTHVETVLKSSTSQLTEDATGRAFDFLSRQETNTGRLCHEQLYFLDDLSHLGVSHNPNATEAAVQPQEDLPSPTTADARVSNHRRDDTSSREHSMAIPDTPSALSLMTSQDIYLCTTIDLLAATQVPIHASFSFFVEEVNPPLISPYDQVNWGRMKMHVIELGTYNEAVAATILAVQALYKAQLNGLTTSRAMSAYHAARTIFKNALDDDTQDFNTILVVTFLLCLFETIVPDETDSVLGHSDGAFVRRLEIWSLQGYHSPVSLRIEVWLKILHVAARRGGGPGLLSDTVSGLLPIRTTEAPSLCLLDNYTDAATSMYEILSAPIFAFYLEIQKISIQVANLSHYHRSRITSSDQDEVTELMTRLKTKMLFMWQTRLGPMRFDPGELRAQFSRAIAEPIVSLIGICTAAYYAEIIDIGRTLSDPPLASQDAKQAMRQIRDIIEGDWNVLSGRKLNPGYLRPLFLYAIESVDKDDTQWAVERLKDIKNPICRSDFFASFANSLAEAQISKTRRVTTRYFCYWAFGVPPPFM